MRCLAMLTYPPSTDPTVHLQPTTLNSSCGADRLQGLPTRQWYCPWDTPTIHKKHPTQPNVRTWPPCGQVRCHPTTGNKSLLAPHSRRAASSLGSAAQHASRYPTSSWTDFFWTSELAHSSHSY